MTEPLSSWELELTGMQKGIEIERKRVLEILDKHLCLNRTGHFECLGIGLCAERLCLSNKNVLALINQETSMCSIKHDYSTLDYCQTCGYRRQDETD